VGTARRREKKYVERCGGNYLRKQMLGKPVCRRENVNQNKSNLIKWIINKMNLKEKMRDLGLK
jgi:hypothetical protein